MVRTPAVPSFQGLNWRQIFNTRTQDLISSTRQRHKRKKLPPPSFDLDQLRVKVLEFLGGDFDGVQQCRYCGAWIDVTNLALDHAIPFKRGGSLDLENIEFPCQPCNLQKGGLTPTEFLALRGFLLELHPAAAQDIQLRLQMAVQHAGARNWAGKKAKAANAQR